MVCHECGEDVCRVEREAQCLNQKGTITQNCKKYKMPVWLAFYIRRENTLDACLVSIRFHDYIRSHQNIMYIKTTHLVYLSMSQLTQNNCGYQFDYNIRCTTFRSFVEGRYGVFRTG